MKVLDKQFPAETECVIMRLFEQNTLGKYRSSRYFTRGG